MKTILAGVTVLLAAGFWADNASAFHSANRYGGSTSHSFGETSHSNAWGGSSEHVAGEGTEHTNAYGGNTAHAYGGGSEHTNMYGGSTYGEAGYGAAHTYPGGATAYHAPGYGYGYGGYGAYHPPVAVPYYSSGCYGCAAAAGAVVGLATGAAIASANTSAVASSAYAAGAANTAAATSSAYSAGVAAGATAAHYEMGVAYASLPSQCGEANIQGANYYVCGSDTWFKPSFGANGVFYRVVPTPH